MDYQKPYAILCAAASKALDALPQTPQTAMGREILQAALWETEEYFLQEDDISAPQPRA